MTLPEADYNEWAGFFSFKPTEVLKWLLNSPCKITFLCTGNQFGKTDTAAMDMILSVMGMHPNDHKNIKPEDTVRTLRFGSQTLPGEKEGDEVRNTQYPALMRRLPRTFIEKDITARRPVVSVKTPTGKNANIEFVSYSQEVQSTAGTQRCLAAGQRVLMADGVWRNIEKIKIGDELVCQTLGGRDDGQRTNKVKNVAYSGMQTVYEVKCQKGIRFEATSNHRIMVPGRGKSKYKYVSELKPGDRVSCRLNNVNGVGSLSEKTLVLLAAFLGDGHTSSKGVHITAKNKDFVRYFARYAKLKQTRTERHGTPQYRIICDEFEDFLKKHKLFGKKAGTKFIPDIVFRESKKNIALFLRTLFYTDGWASGHSIGYCSTSYRLAQDVHFLLRRFQVQSSFRERCFTNGWNTQYWVMISQSKYVLRFIEQIGIVLKEPAVEKVRLEADRRVNVRTWKESRDPNYIKVKEINCIGEKKTYDIEMEVTGWEKRPIKIARSPRNNFIIQGGIVSHNSRIWLDEESSRDFFEEQIPRLLAADGDVLITMTPVPGSIGWQFDLFYERAKYIYRTKAVRDRIYERTGELLPECEITESKDDICVIMAATDDNPIYEDLAKKRSEQTGKPVTAKEYVDTLFEMYDDEDVIDARRYGIFSQLSSKVYKSFTPAVHIISQQKYFPEGIPHDWKHYRGIDYHMNTPWACVWMSISPQNEAFVWCDYAANPAKMITYDIALGVAQRSGDYKYMLNLIDPLASTKQVNTNLSTIEDMNRYFVEFRKQDIGTGGHWQGWDTKGGRGREEFIKRMLNSIKVGKPFNNKVITGQDAMQRTELLPTVWITDNCRNVIESVKNWRFEEWKSREAFAKHEMKETTQKRWSHFPIAVECLFKNPMVSNAKWGDVSGAPKRPKQYFHVR